nr:hypothetical protein [uncultured Methanobacterium sp.]
MKKAPIALVAIIVVFAFVGGYFTGIMNSAGNLTLNVSNKTADSSSNYDTPTTYSTNTAKTTKTTASTTSADTSTPAADTSTPSGNTQTEPSGGNQTG